MRTRKPTHVFMVSMRCPVGTTRNEARRLLKSYIAIGEHDSANSAAVETQDQTGESDLATNTTTKVLR